MKDVANAVGVSHTTVSNAFNRPDQLSPKLRETSTGSAALSTVTALVNPWQRRAP